MKPHNRRRLCTSCEAVLPRGGTRDTPPLRSDQRRHRDTHRVLPAGPRSALAPLRFEGAVGLGLHLAALRAAPPSHPAVLPRRPPPQRAAGLLLVKPPPV